MTVWQTSALTLLVKTAEIEIQRYGTEKETLKNIT